MSKNKKDVNENEDPVEEVQPVDKEKSARLIVDKYAKWSFGVGFIPFPVLDLVGLTAVQVKMLSEIAQIYGQSLSDNKLRSTVSSFLSGLLPHVFGKTAGTSLLKSFPVLGHIASATVLPVASAGATYAIGNAFIKHFEGGGTFLSLNFSSLGDQVKGKMAKFRSSKPSEDKAEVTSQTA